MIILLAILSYLGSYSSCAKDNILVSSEGSPLLADFGVSRIIDMSSSPESPPSSGTAKGSTRYLAVELLEWTEDAARQNEKSDVWAFGMTVYASTMLTY